jgi:hypothetical protein
MRHGKAAKDALSEVIAIYELVLLELSDVHPAEAGLTLATVTLVAERCESSISSRKSHTNDRNRINLHACHLRLRHSWSESTAQRMRKVAMFYRNAPCPRLGSATEFCCKGKVHTRLCLSMMALFVRSQGAGSSSAQSDSSRGSRRSTCETAATSASVDPSDYSAPTNAQRR